MTSRQAQIDEAVKQLSKSDPVMRSVVRRCGPCTLPRRRDRFAMLVRSIISQQISVHAARAIRGRLETRLLPAKIAPESLAKFSVDQLRSVGLSAQKASYILDLADKTLSGEVRFDRLRRLSDEAVIDELTKVKGIGRWTAQMLLIFSLGRLDILAVDDQGLRSAVRDLYGLDGFPTKQEFTELAQPWRPYASIASWYCWRHADSK
jgi:DNA-3-methyladenine glycosylase II